MKSFQLSGILLILATLAFLGWTLLLTVFLPVEDYANVTHAYAESTNAIVRGMAIGIAAYFCCVATIFGWQLTWRPAQNSVVK